MRIMIRDALDLANLWAAEASRQGEQVKQGEQREPGHGRAYTKSPVILLATERGSC